MRVLLFVAPLACAGCLVLNPAYDGGVGGSSGAGETSAAATGGTTSVAPTTEGTGTTVLGGSASDGGSTGGTSGTSVGETTSTGDSDGLTGGGESTAAASTGGTEPPSEHIEYYDDLSQCNLPFWCANDYPMPLKDGILAKYEDIVCFTASLTPPFELDRIGYKMMFTKGQVAGTFALVHYAWDGGGPGQILGSYPIDDPGLVAQETYHDLVPPEPIVISQQKFCLGFVGGQPGSSAFALAQQEFKVIEDVSWVRTQACGLGLRDIASFQPGTARFGTWCVDIDITEVGG